MSDDTFAEKLEWFKQNEKPEVVLLIADNSQLIQIAVAWTNTTVKRTESPGKPGDISEGEMWDWLWEHTQYSREELLQKSSLSEYGFDHRMRTLIGNRVLYPDGTVNSYVQRHLREKVLKLFEGKPKRTTKKTG